MNFISWNLWFSFNYLFNNENLKIAKVSGKIDISGNSGWIDFRNAGNCTGSGTEFDPYIIKDLVIDGGGSGDCIYIQSSDVYFKIENCTTFNTPEDFGVGIYIYNVENGKLIDNDCSLSRSGILLSHCVNNSILGNSVYSNYRGIYVSYSNNNNFSGNTIESSEAWGIDARYSHNNTFLENTIHNNNYAIVLIRCNYNIICGNSMVGNRVCFEIIECEGNIIEKNICDPSRGIPPELIIIISSTIGGGVVIGIAIALFIRKRRKVA